MNDKAMNIGTGERRSVEDLLRAESERGRQFRAGLPVLPQPVVMADPAAGFPTAWDDLMRLIRAGRLFPFLHEFYEWPTPDGLGNAHDVSLAFMASVLACQEDAGWTWVWAEVLSGATGKWFDHSWIERDGWAIDASHGLLKIMPAEAYRQQMQARKIELRAGPQVRQYLQEHHPKLMPALDRAGRIDLYDVQHQSRTSIPVQELAPGVLSGRLTTGQDVAVDVTQLKQGTRYYHPRFGRQIRKRIRRIAQALQEVHPMTVEQWEDGFRRDLHAENELGLFEHVAEVYTRLAKGRSPEQKADLYQALILATSNTLAVFRQVFQPRSIEMYEAIRAYQMLHARLGRG